MLTKDKILAMTPQELAEATAVRVMGWGAVKSNWNPAFDMLDAMSIAERVQRKTLHFHLEKDATMMWVSSFYAGSHYARASTATKAISRAALLALGDGVNGN
ncbi:hypothetical protein ACE3MQ_25090 [Paenibacillus lentus]|uniref:BC1872 family protein n=1 Tax=Paenibacillus lentus TaxID=1338368 RepID=UPI00364BEBD5